MSVHLISFLKAFHIIFLVSWFSGLFFLGRMFIYHAEAEEKSALERNAVQEFTRNAIKRVWNIIILPSMILTIILGLTLMVKLGSIHEPWFHFKLTMLILFFGYIHACAKIKKKILTGSAPLKNSVGLRLFNELPFLFVAVITFTVIPHSPKAGIAALAGMLVLFGITAIAYKRKK